MSRKNWRTRASKAARIAERNAKTMRFTAPVQLAAAAAGKPRKLLIVGYTGGKMRVRGYGEIAIDLAGLELPATIPVLADHDATLSGVIGPGKPSTDGRQLIVEAELADTPAAKTVLSIIESGVQLQASLGADATEREREPVAAGDKVQVNGQTLTGPFTLITKAKLKEMTVTPLGADDKTSVSLAARSAAKGVRAMFKAMLTAAKTSGNAIAAKFSDEEIDKMTETEAKAALKDCMAQADDDDDEDLEKKPASAKALLSITHGMPELQARAAAEEWSETRCRIEALHHLRASRPRDFTTHHAGSGPDFSANAASAALIMRASGEAVAIRAFGERTVEAVRTAGLERMTFAELFAVHLRANNIDPGPRRDVESMIRANAGASSANLTNLLSNSLNKLLELQWPQAPGTWRSWCAIRPAKDFKPASSLRPVFNGSLTVLAQSGEITHGNLTDSLISWQLYSFAKMFTIARQMMINDDLSGLQELPMGLALMADRAVSDLAYWNLLSNTGTFFSTGNGNNQTSGSSALSSTSVKTAIKQMRLQVGPNNAPLNIPPATLVVGPSNEQTAKEILHSSFQFRNVTSDDRLPAGNPLEEAVKLVVEPRLELGATNPITGATVTGVAAQWFLFSAPTFLPAIMGFLNGAETPQVQMADPLGFNFQVPGMSWRCIYDFGFSLGDYRAAQRSVGS